MQFFNLPSNNAFMITLKAAIVHDGKALILRSTADHRNWELPGGLVDIDEDLEAGLKREVLEETTLKVEVTDKILGVWDGWRTGFRFSDGSVRDIRVIEIIYQCNLVSGDIELSKEHDESRWATPEEMQLLPMFSEQRKAVERQFRGHPSKERL